MRFFIEFFSFQCLDWCEILSCGGNWPGIGGNTPGGPCCNEFGGNGGCPGIRFGGGGCGIPDELITELADDTGIIWPGNGGRIGGNIIGGTPGGGGGAPGGTFGNNGKRPGGIGIGGGAPGGNLAPGGKACGGRIGGAFGGRIAANAAGGTKALLALNAAAIVYDHQ